jgi:L-lactate dehydrogenase (cytochrome)
MPFRQPRRLEECHSILDLRSLARRRLPSPIYHYLDGAAETEWTARRNTAAFDDHDLIPRCLVDVTNVATAMSVFGQELQWPVICSATGGSRFFHPEGEAAVARAASAAGTLYGLSITATRSLEDIAAVAQGPKFLQLYVFKDRSLTENLIERAKRSGYKALCLTVDTAVTGKRERDLRTGWGVPIRLSARSLASFAGHPFWFWRQLRKGSLSMPNVAEQTGDHNIVAQTRFIAEQLDTSVTWQDARRMIELWGGPFAIKGVMAGDDARRAVDIGASAVIVSNHGGRQLDGAAASFDALPDIAQAVGSEVEVILDGGIRRGVHVLKALARGAKACSIGRPYLYGLAAGGEAGVTRTLQILRSELVRAMQLSGCTDVKAVDASLLRRLCEQRDPP